MRAIDTNIIVRVFTADDAKQAKAARRVIEAGDIFIGTTVVLETEWVLRAGYGFESAQIAGGLRGLFGLAGVTVEETAETAQALDWMSQGMDFADALHLARSSHCSSFVSFDRKQAKRARSMAPISVEALDGVEWFAEIPGQLYTIWPGGNFVGDVTVLSRPTTTAGIYKGQLRVPKPEYAGRVEATGDTFKTHDIYEAVREVVRRAANEPSDAFDEE